MAGLGDWDFNNFHVQAGLTGGKFIGAHSTLIAAAPPKLSMSGIVGTGAVARNDLLGDLSATAGHGETKRASTSVFAWPIGVCENVGIGQNKQLTRLFEIGSRRSYFIVGRNIVNLSLARTMYDGPNLLRALYAYWTTSLLPTGAEKQNVAQLLSTQGLDSRFKQVQRTAGYADFFINLDSDLFDNPFGLFMMFFDSLKDPYGALFVEDCHIQNHQFGVSSQANLVGEGVTVQGDQLLPVNIGALNFEQSTKSVYDTAI